MESFPSAWTAEVERSNAEPTLSTIPALLKSLFSSGEPADAASSKSAASHSRKPSVSPTNDTTTNSSVKKRSPSTDKDGKRSRNASQTRDKPAKQTRPIRLSTIGPGITRELAASTSSTNINVGRQMPDARYTAAPSEPFSPSSPSVAEFPRSDSIYRNFSNIPGFPLHREIVHDDAVSVSSFGAVTNNTGRDLMASQIFRRLRGQGLSRDFWLPDELSKQCRDCGSVFTALRRKHHCRICGQIFCSTCASNIISGVRFGYKGYLRICNDCLAKMDDEVQHRGRQPPEEYLQTKSTLATSTNRPTISVPLESQYRGPQSQFAASVLFPRSEFPLINEHDDSLDDLQSRPATPIEPFDYEQDGLASPFAPALQDMHASSYAPFRKHASEDGLNVADAMQQDFDIMSETPKYISSDDRVPFPQVGAFGPTVDEASPTIASNHTPTSITVSRDQPSPRQSPQYPRPLTPSSSSVHLMASRLNRIDSRPRISSRATEMGLLEDLPRSDSSNLRRNVHHERPRRESISSLDTDLASVNFSFIRALLRQCLVQQGFQDPSLWIPHLMMILARLTRSVRNDIKGNNDSIDIRKYIKIKRLPGGRPCDCSYVDGLVFTKNLIHRNMSRMRSSPRIMLLAFPIEYQLSTDHFMSLEPLIAQEQKYLEKLVKRIASFRPHIVVVGYGVSQVALRFFLEHKIAVVKHVKPSVMQALSRCTGADIISSMDQLLTQPTIGRCSRLKVESYDHKLIPGRRKTLMRFEGCGPELGACIILRGGDIASLTKIKAMLNFMSLIANSLRMESFLFYDEHVSMLRLPSSTFSLPPEEEEKLLRWQQSKPSSLLSEEAHKASASIALALKPFLDTILSSSPFTVFPPPLPILQAQLDDIALNVLRKTYADEEAAALLREEQETALSRKSSVSESEGGQATELTVAETAASDFGSVLDYATRASLPPRTGSYLAAAVAGPASVSLSLAAQLEEGEDRHNDKLALFDIYRLRHSSNLDPARHQKLTVLCSVVNSATLKTCVVPELRTMSYYSEGDQTLGQFIETYIAEANRFCPLSTCQQACLLHYKVFVHGSRRITAILEQFPCPVPGGQDRIYLWSYCKICESPAKHTVMSEQTWAYSFARYLELSFYPGQLGCRTISPYCPHNIHKDHVRYFSYKNLAVRIYSDDVDVSEVMQPPLHIKMRKELAVQLREEEFKAIAAKHSSYWTSLEHRLRSLNLDVVAAERLPAAQQVVEDMLKKIDVDRKALKQQLAERHSAGQWSSGIVLNVVRRIMQDKIVEWDNDFLAFESKFAGTDRDKDLRRLTGYQLKRLFADSSTPGSPEHKSGFETPPISEKVASQDCDDAASAVSNISTIELPALRGPISELSEANLAELDSRLLDMPTGISLKASPNLRSSPNMHSQDSIAKRAFFNEDSSGSDTTICAEPQTMHAFHAANETSASENEDVNTAHASPAAGTPIKRSRKPLIVADLVKQFNTSPQRDKSVGNEVDKLVPSIATPSRPNVKRGKSDLARSKLGSHAKEGSQTDPEEAQAPTLSKILRKSKLKFVPTRSRLDDTQAMIPTKQSEVKSVGRPALLQRKSTIKPSKQNLASPNASIDKAQPSPMKSLSTGPGSSRHLGGLAASRVGLQSRRVVSASQAGSKVSTIARHFDRLSREAERDRQKRLVFLRGKRARPVAIARPTIEVYTSAKEALKEDSDNESDQGSAGADDELEAEDHQTNRAHTGDSDKLARQPSLTESFIYDEPPMDAKQPVHHQLPHIEHTVARSVECSSIIDESSSREASAPTSPTVSTFASNATRMSQLSESEMSSSGTDRNSLMKAISSLWTNRGLEFAPLQYPLDASEHIFANNPVIIREDEPSSIIAFALASRAYKDKVKEMEYGPKFQESETFMPTEENNLGHAAEKASNWGLVDLPEGMDPDEQMRKLQVQHFRLQFEEGSFKFSCKVFFAEQFDALRRKCGCEESFIDSLARCFKWDASGGKSGSAFLKTRDDRFIIKEISRLEMDAFLRCAPAYFEYTTRAFFHTLPTLLAKVFGFFRLSFTAHGKTTRMDVLVMENLFYDRSITKIYDLKGSKRNRHVVTTGKRGEVLLDENLIEMAYKSPLYVTEQSKKLLRMSLFNDTLFLEKLNVMDYSLIVGVDSSRHELVVGIIDYIRTYTWDKKVENWVKGTGRIEPTIITPKLYKNRLRAASEEYFCLVPDKWISDEYQQRQVSVEQTSHTQDERTD